jgi:uncharacterized protein (DUF1015 family)
VTTVEKALAEESPLMLTPREAAALDRLLDAYVRTDQGDPGLEDLKSVRHKLLLVSQNHIVYATWRS